MIWKKLKNRIEPRHIAVTSAALVLAGVMAAMMLVPPKGTSAYVEMSTGVFDNIMNISKVPNEIIEENFTGTVKTNVKIQNMSNYSKAYVRAAVTANWVKTDSEGNSTGEVYAEKPVLGADKDYTVTWTKEGWVLGKDGYYYYPTMLNAQDVTGVLLTECKQVSTANQPDGYKLSVEIMAQTIQAEGYDSTVTATNGYENLPVYLAWGTGKGGSVKAVSFGSLVIDSYDVYVYYSGHFEGYGNVAGKINGQTLGAVDDSRRLEAISVRVTGGDFDGTDKSNPKGNVEYQAYSCLWGNAEKTGWFPKYNGVSTWATQGGLAGTVGDSTRMYSVKIKLTDNSVLASKYNIKYQVFMQQLKEDATLDFENSDWLPDVYSNGQVAGIQNPETTTINSNTPFIGAIRIWLEPKSTT